MTELFDVPARPEYLAAVSKAGKSSYSEASKADLPVLIFSLHQGTFALPLQFLKEVLADRAIRSLPHNPSKIVRGVVNRHGRLQLAASLHQLFGLPSALSYERRLIVMEMDKQSWAFVADKVTGVDTLFQKDVAEPLTAQQLENAHYISGVVDWKGDVLYLLEPKAIFDALAKEVRL